MRALCLLLATASLLSSCDPPNVEPCDIENVVENEYKGYSNICNANPTHQLFFESKLSLSEVDTFLAIKLVSLDTAVIFEYYDTLSYLCKEVNSEDVYFNLFKSGIRVGSVSDIQINIPLFDIENCLDNSSFTGAPIK